MDGLWIGSVLRCREGKNEGTKEGTKDMVKEGAKDGLQGVPKGVSPLPGMLPAHHKVGTYKHTSYHILPTDTDTDTDTFTTATAHSSYHTTVLLPFLPYNVTVNMPYHNSIHSSLS